MTANMTTDELAAHVRATSGLPVETDRCGIILTLEAGHVRVDTIARNSKRPSYLVETYLGNDDEPRFAKAVFSIEVLGRAVREAAARVDPAITPYPDPEPRAVAERLAALTIPMPRSKR